MYKIHVVRRMFHLQFLTTTATLLGLFSLEANTVFAGERSEEAYLSLPQKATSFRKANEPGAITEMTIHQQKGIAVCDFSLGAYSQQPSSEAAPELNAPERGWDLTEHQHPSNKKKRWMRARVCVRCACVCLCLCVRVCACRCSRLIMILIS